MRKCTAVLVVLLFAFQTSRGQETLSQGTANNYYQSGLDLIAHQAYGPAHAAFGKFLESRRVVDARTADARYFRAFCAATLLHADGEKQLQSFVDDHPEHPRSMVAYYDLACAFYADKSYIKASSYFSKVRFQNLSTEQQNIGRFRWGYSLFTQKNMLGALDQFNTIKALGGQYGPAASYYAGFIELSAGDYENALTDLKRAEKTPSYSGIVPPMIATIYQKLGKDDDLIRYAEEILDRDDVSSPDELYLLVAEALFRKADYNKALARYISYFDAHESVGRQILYRAGYSAWVVQDESHALSFLKRSASDADSVGIHASYLLGSIYLKRGEKNLALTAFETSKKFSKDPRVAEESLFASAKLNYDLGNPDVAIGEFEMVLEKYPQSSHVIEIRELLSQAYVNANNFNKALAYIDALTRRTPAVDKAYQKAAYLKGTEFFNKEDYASASQYFEKSLQYPLDDRITIEASYWQGETYSIGRRYEEAIPNYERALSHASAHPEMVQAIRYGLGYAHYNLQHYDKANLNFREFASRSAKSPHYSDGLLRLADCQYVLKSYQEALATYKRVIQLSSVDSDYAHLQCGIIYAILRQYGEAGRELNLVSGLGTSRYADEATFNLGQIDFERGNYASAITHFTRLLQPGKTNRFVPYALSRRASSNYNLKNYNETANDYISVVERYPTHAVAQDLLLPLQEALRLSDRSSEFDKYLATFKQANPDAKGIEGVEFESARTLYFSQQYAKAIDKLQVFSVSYPDSPHLAEAAYYQAESYYRLKDYEKSLSIHLRISSDPTFSLASKVTARVAELQFRLKHYDLAAVAFHRLKTTAVNKKDEYTALNGLMESYYLLGQYDSTAKFARKIQELGGVNASSLSKATLYLGKCAKARGDYETAKDEFLATINAAQDEYGAEAKYLLGEIFYLKKEYPACQETLISLNHDFAAYEDWVGKSFLLLADSYTATGELFQAKGTLKSLIDNFPKQEVKDLATEKLKAIEQQELKKAPVEKTDSTDNKP